MPKKTWVANYIYEGPDGQARTDMRLVTAYTEEEAHEFAVQYPPAAEFVVSLHPQTDDQFLGSVRQNAARIKELREDHSLDGHALREVLNMLLRDPDADVGEDIDEYVAGDGDADDQVNGRPDPTD